MGYLNDSRNSTALPGNMGIKLPTNFANTVPTTAGNNATKLLAEQQARAAAQKRAEEEAARLAAEQAAAHANFLKNAGDVGYIGGQGNMMDELRKARVASLWR